MTNWITAIYLPPPEQWAYTFLTLPGSAFSVMPRIDASVGIPAILTCSSEGPMQDCMIGSRRWVTALTLISGIAGFIAPV